MNRRSLVGSCTALALLGSMLAACGKEGGNEPGPSSPAAGSTDPKERKPVTIQVLTQSFGSKMPAEEDNWVKKVLKEKTGVIVDMTNPPDNEYKNLLNARMAGSDFPDLFMLDKDQLKQYSDQGLLLDLTPYLNGKMKPVKDYLGENELKKGTVNGKIYALPKKPQIPYQNLWIRKDWLAKLNLQVPTTLDELVQVAKAFTEQDPDGNGKKDTYGYGGVGISALAPIFGAYGVGVGGAVSNFYVKDGKLINTLYDPDMKAAIDFVAKFIKTGYADPDLLVTNTEVNAAKKGFQGKVGMLYVGFPNMTSVQYVREYKEINPNAEWVQVAPPKGPKGSFSGTWDIGSTPGLHAVPKSLEKQPEKLQAIIDLLNYIASSEGAQLVANGVENRHWKLENGQVVRLEARVKEHFWAYQLLGRNELDYLKPGYPAQDVELAAKTPRVEAINSFITIPNGYNPADAKRYIDEELAKFLYGTRPLAEYDSFLKTLEGTFQFRMMIEAANAAAKEYKVIP
ncbi:extracellular solute-binding protein [Paenibacillus flagellatus]|uniref:ABC transporter substrate-binding protein n=1 Tax=Paenibacillus flagellatus TaxID=2211139 RepID=A0A2V5KUF6_9BACL|nr:extracellular solute-binding protein [Paenibacillus flagellatus]PYI55537.1 ABC transporter substrate-binding protein [Paenibacillus flagellatus]